MPAYDSIEELPAEISERFPARACELYRATYNRVADKLAAAQSDAGAEGCAQLIAEKAHDAAMLTIRTEFERQEDGTWNYNPVGEDMEQIGKAAEDDNNPN